MTDLTDELAGALQLIVNDLLGYSNCPTMQALADKATPVLAKYAAAKAKQQAEQEIDACQLWLREHYNDLWLEWLGAASVHLMLWLDAQYPDVRAEFIRRQP